MKLPFHSQFIHELQTFFARKTMIYRQKTSNDQPCPSKPLRTSNIDRLSTGNPVQYRIKYTIELMNFRHGKVHNWKLLYGNIRICTLHCRLNFNNIKIISKCNEIMYSLSIKAEKSPYSADSSQGQPPA